MAASPPLGACCPPDVLLLHKGEAERLAAALKALADPVRLRILHHVASAPDTTVCACHLPEMLGISQPTLSHHVKKLVGAGLLSREKRGRWAHYRLDSEAVGRLVEALAGRDGAARAAESG